MMTTVKVKIEVAPVKEKKKRKERKRRRGSNMEENNNLILRSGSYWMDNKENMPVAPGITKIYEPLPECSELNVKKEDLHILLQKYLLTEKELLVNKYPRPRSVMGEAFSPDGLVRRKCFRCKKIFYVSLDGKYAQFEVCNYHPERCKMVAAGATPKQVHGCCNQPSGSPACASFNGHVCGDPILSNARFKSVRDKRCIRQDQKNAIYALDCEMVFTSAGLQVAKVGVVNHQGLTIYETFVLPDNEIVDYNTRYSGVTAKDLQGITTTLTDVQTYLDQLLNKDSILIGHALNSDLKMLRLLHDRIIDTSVMFPRMDGTKQKLKDLAYFYLKKTIQNNPDGHDCIEDARASMALVLNKLKQDQLESSQKAHFCKRQIGSCLNYKKSDCNNNLSFYNKTLHPRVDVFTSVNEKEMMLRSDRRQYIHQQIYSEKNVLWVC